MTSVPVQLGQVVTVDRTAATDADCSRLPYVGLEHIQKDTGVFEPEYRRRPETLLATKFRFTPKHVLYSKLRPYLNKVVIPDFDGVCTTEVLPLLPDERQLDSTYLYFLLRSRRFVAWASHNVSGINLPRLDPEMLQEFEFLLPSLKEQRQTADELLHSQSLVQSRRYALQLCDEFRVVSFRDALRAVETTPTALIDLCKKITDGVHITPTYVRHGVPFLRVTDVQDDRIDWDNVKRIPQEEYDLITRRTKPARGDILYSKNGTIGVAKEITWDVPFAHFVSLALLKPRSELIHSTFLAEWLNTPDALKQATSHSKTGTVTNLHLNEIEQILVPLPTRSDQERLVALITQSRALRSTHVEALRQADHLFQTLLHDAFA